MLSSNIDYCLNLACDHSHIRTTGAPLFSRKYFFLPIFSRKFFPWQFFPDHFFRGLFPMTFFPEQFFPPSTFVPLDILNCRHDCIVYQAVYGAHFFLVSSVELFPALVSTWTWHFFPHAIFFHTTYFGLNKDRNCRHDSIEDSLKKTRIEYFKGFRIRS